jgi:hypothetical protein
MMFRRTLSYLFVHKLGVRYFAENDGTVDWDKISLGTLLDVLASGKK